MASMDKVGKKRVREYSVVCDRGYFNEVHAELKGIPDLSIRPLKNIETFIVSGPNAAIKAVRETIFVVEVVLSEERQILEK